jgi:hypothetical protein
MYKYKAYPCSLLNPDLGCLGGRTQQATGRKNIHGLLRSGTMGAAVIWSQLQVSSIVQAQISSSYSSSTVVLLYSS